MNVGYRIKTIRKFRGLTQKELGIRVGFDLKTADIRVAQYESGTRTPKESLLNEFATALNVSPSAFVVPNISSINDIFYILFALEDECGLSVNVLDNRLCLSLNSFENIEKNGDLVKFFMAWKNKSDALSSGNISKEEYDDWKYNFPSIQ